MYSYNLNFDATALSNYHYTCWNKSGECETLSYVYHVNGYSPYYINLSNGEGVDDAITNMLYRDDNDYHVNKNDSTAKTAVEAWYKKYIYDKYDKYIEDTIYCNDRSINNNGPFNPNGGNIKGNSLYFRGKTSDLSCLNETDMFSTYNNKAKTSYKIGLITASEINILGNINVLDVKNLLTMTPANFSYSETNMYVGYSSGSYLSQYSVYTTSSLRPVISLSPIAVVDGDGSMEHPYRVDDGTN